MLPENASLPERNAGMMLPAAARGPSEQQALVKSACCGHSHAFTGTAPTHHWWLLGPINGSCVHPAPVAGPSRHWQAEGSLLPSQSSNPHRQVPHPQIPDA